MAKDNTTTTTVRSRRVWILQTVIQLICVTLLLVLPDVIASLSHPQGHDVPGIVYFKVLLFVVVFYLNYSFIISRTLGTRHGAIKFLSINLVIAVAVLSILYFNWIKFGPISMPEHGPRMAPVGPPPARLAPFDLSALVPLVRDAVVIILVVALSAAIKLASNWSTLEQREREVESKQKEMELRLLKAQLNPHFLFNTLNCIYALVEISPTKAQSAIHKLSKMLRYMLYENPQSVTLATEIDFIDNYVTLMRMRLSSGVSLKTVFDGGDSASLSMSPMLFINIVENMFKHGMKSKSGVDMDISITANNGIVVCHASNTYDPTEEVSTTSSGVGLANLRRRLDLQYPARYRLDITKAERFDVQLEINISEPPDISIVTPLQAAVNDDKTNNSPSNK